MGGPALATALNVLSMDDVRVGGGDVMEEPNEMDLGRAVTEAREVVRGRGVCLVPVPELCASD